MRRPSDSLVTGLVLLAFSGFSLWLLQRTHVEPEEKYSTLTTHSPRPSGALAFYELLTKFGYEPQRHNETEYHYPEQACVVVLDPAGRFAMMGGLDRKAVRLWLEDGGTLVLCAENDPGGYGIAAQLFEELQADKPDPKEVQRLAKFGVDAVRAGEGTKGRLSPPSRIEGGGDVYKLPAKRPELFKGVEQIEHTDTGPVEVTGVRLLQSDAPVLWYRKVGEGELYWLTRPEMASNAWISRADNHRFLLNLIDVAADGKPLYFDEHIHGYLRAAPNIMALLLRTRGGHLLLELCGLALLLFAGAAVRPARFAVEYVPERRQGLEMVLAQADLYERAGARHVIADSQIDSLRRTYMERRHLAAPPSEAQILDWLDREWRGPAERKALLLEYLRSRLLPRSHGALLELARACDEAKSMLT